MLFNSIEFIFFLPAVLLLYFLLPHKLRWFFLFAASCAFYMAFVPSYILILFAIIILDYFSAILIERSKTNRQKKGLLIISLIANIGFLAFFKYFNFLNWNVTALLSHFEIDNPVGLLNVILPIGLSFHTFQSMGYTLDVYHGRQKAERHLGIYSLYVLFFPQMVAGPIERFSRLGEQLKIHQKFSYENFANGGRLILFGFFTKMVIADNLSIYVNDVYADPALHHSNSVITALLMYSFQIYADFYGYSLIALGSARILGINLMDNFRNPYLSKTIPEFWQRWHISLSSWFRDYLFLPIASGFSKKMRKRRYLYLKTEHWIYIFASLITMLLCGLWHGANWTFVVWGGLHGIFMLYHNLTTKFRKRSIHKLRLGKLAGFVNVWQIVFTFMLVTATWVFFRSENFKKAGLIFKSTYSNNTIKDKFHVDHVIWVLLGVFILTDILLFNNRFDKWCSQKPMYVCWFSYIVLLFAILALSGVDNSPFIYFQF